MNKKIHLDSVISSSLFPDSLSFDSTTEMILRDEISLCLINMEWPRDNSSPEYMIKFYIAMTKYYIPC